MVEIQAEKKINKNEKHLEEAANGHIKDGIQST